jgi:hypothetical protein
MLAEFAPRLVAERSELEGPIREIPRPCSRPGLSVAWHRQGCTTLGSTPWLRWLAAPRISGGR